MRFLIALLAILFLTSCEAPVLFPAEKCEYAKGDVNGDGRVDRRDAAIVASFDAGSIGLDQCEWNAADFNGDGEVTYADAKLILEYFVNNGS